MEQYLLFYIHIVVMCYICVYISIYCIIISIVLYIFCCTTVVTQLLHTDVNCDTIVEKKIYNKFMIYIPKNLHSKSIQPIQKEHAFHSFMHVIHILIYFSMYCD